MGFINASTDQGQLVATMNDLLSRTLDIEKRLSKIPVRFGMDGGGDGGTVIIMCTLGVAVLDGTNRWTYPITEVEKSTAGYGSGKWQTKSGGITGTARNLFEFFNSGSGMTGLGLTVEEIEDVDCPFSIIPIVGGLIVPVYTLITKTEMPPVTEYWFSAPNSVKPQP